VPVILFRMDVLYFTISKKTTLALMGSDIREDYFVGYCIIHP